MHSNGGNYSSGSQPGAPSPGAPADFGRRRVSRILQSEQPRLEQELPSPDLSDHMHRMMMESGDDLIAWSFNPSRRVLSGYCRWRRVLVTANVPLRDLWKARKSAANLNSRYLSRPSHPRP